MFSVHAGPETARFSQGSVQRFELKTSRLSCGLERDLRFDAAFLRHFAPLRRALRDFQPDLVHITGPNHPGILGALLAWSLQLPIVASWHTNVHEYASSRLIRRLNWLPLSAARACSAWAARASLWAAARYYSTARITLAPNPELVSMLEQRTGNPCHLMRRGVDTALYSPDRRDRSDSTLVIGYVGRLSPEKNVRLLASIEPALLQAGISDFRIEIAGHGGERHWLSTTIRPLADHGVLHGEALARAYAGFDIFAFPSETDTYGNVVQEAMASGVPCVVTSLGGPAHIVTHSHDGLVASGSEDFIRSVLRLSRDPQLRARLGANARNTALNASWDRVMDGVYVAYRHALAAPAALPAPLSS